MLATLVLGTAAVSLVIGLLFGASVSRALSVGWYVVGCALLIALVGTGAASAAAGPRYDVPRGFTRCSHALAWHGFTLNGWLHPFDWQGLPEAVRTSLVIAVMSTTRSS